jgi:ABC-type phosphate transport system permease subunit
MITPTTIAYGDMHRITAMSKIPAIVYGLLGSGMLITF